MFENTGTEDYFVDKCAAWIDDLNEGTIDSPETTFIADVNQNIAIAIGEIEGILGLKIDISLDAATKFNNYTIGLHINGQRS